jgi:hypothetical protein
MCYYVSAKSFDFYSKRMGQGGVRREQRSKPDPRKAAQVHDLGNADARSYRYIYRRGTGGDHVEVVPVRWTCTCTLASRSVLYGVHMSCEDERTLVIRGSYSHTFYGGIGGDGYRFGSPWGRAHVRWDGVWGEEKEKGVS